MKKKSLDVLPCLLLLTLGAASLGLEARAENSVADKPLANGEVLRYQVQSGDSLVLILKHFRKFAYGDKGLLETFRAQNAQTLSARQNDLIFPGDTLVLPFTVNKPSRHYFVQDGYAVLGQPEQIDANRVENAGVDNTASIGAAGAIGSKKHTAKSEEEVLFPTIDDKVLRQLPTKTAKSDTQPSTEELDRILQSVENK